MVPDVTTKYYKNVGRYLLHRDSLTNANAKKYYSESDWKILIDIEISHTPNTWVS